MKLGYARVSTDDQSLDVQLALLKHSGCVEIFSEKESGKNSDRSALKALLAKVEYRCPGCANPNCGKDRPVVVVTKLDRLGRNTRDLLEIADRLAKADAGLVSLAEPWADTTSPAGKLIMTVFAGIAEFERARILERTSEGRAHARKRGTHMGRPAKLSNEQQRAAVKMCEDTPLKTVARIFRVSLRTLRTYRGR